MTDLAATDPLPKAARDWMENFIDQAAFFLPRMEAIVDPISDGVSAIVTPQFFKMSTFSAADSPNAETIAPAWPMRRPFGADNPAMYATTGFFMFC